MYSASQGNFLIAENMHFPIHPYTSMHTHTHTCTHTQKKICTHVRVWGDSILNFWWIWSCCEFLPGEVKCLMCCTNCSPGGNIASTISCLLGFFGAWGSKAEKIWVGTWCTCTFKAPGVFDCDVAWSKAHFLSNQKCRMILRMFRLGVLICLVQVSKLPAPQMLLAQLFRFVSCALFTDFYWFGCQNL